jgi:hypothetical protein
MSSSLPLPKAPDSRSTAPGASLHVELELPVEAPLFSDR